MLTYREHYLTEMGLYGIVTFMPFVFELYCEQKCCVKLWLACLFDAWHVTGHKSKF